MHRPSILDQQDWPPGRQKKKTGRLAYGFIGLSVGLVALVVLLNGPHFANGAQPAPSGVAALPPKAEPAPAVSTPEAETEIVPAAPVPVQRVSLPPERPLPDKNLRVLHVPVKYNLNHSLCSVLPEEDCHFMAAMVARLLAWSMDISSALRPGDHMHLIYEAIEGNERFRILKLEYRSRFLNRILDINYYQTPSMPFGSYFDENGRELTSHLSSSTAPIRGYSEITSLPGDFRKGRDHAGVDFKAEVGTPVYASFNGKVLRTNWNRARNGMCIELDHPREGVRTLYLHLNEVHVRAGQEVRQGQHIGASGNTGRSFAPHLHYEMRGRDAKKMVHNPFSFKYHKKYRRQIARGNLADYLKTVRLYDSLLRES